jgi:hypothetical protein
MRTDNLRGPKIYHAQRSPQNLDFGAIFRAATIWRLSKSSLVIGHHAVDRPAEFDPARALVLESARSAGPQSGRHSAERTLVLSLGIYKRGHSASRLVLQPSKMLATFDHVVQGTPRRHVVGL